MPLTKAEQAAVVIAQLDDVQAARVLERLTDDEVVSVMAEVARLSVVAAGDIDEVIDDFCRCVTTLGPNHQGGLPRASHLLRGRLGRVRAADVLREFETSGEDRPFSLIDNLSSDQLVEFFDGEHPQLLALIFANCSVDQAARVLDSLPEANRAEVMRRIARIKAVPAHVIRVVSDELRKRFAVLGYERFRQRSDGVETVVAILNSAKRPTERQVLADLETLDPAIAEAIKDRMFVFDDVIALDDGNLQVVIRGVSMRTMALAMKGKGPDVLAKVRKNITERQAQDLAEELANIGPQPLSRVEEAESQLVQLLRDLVDEGEIVVERGGDVFVA